MERPDMENLPKLLKCQDGGIVYVHLFRDPQRYEYIAVDIYGPRFCNPHKLLYKDCEKRMSRLTVEKDLTVFATQYGHRSLKPSEQKEFPKKFIASERFT